VLILPPGHGIGRSLSKRERWMVGGVLGVVAALAVVLVISLISTGPSSGHGCIYATIPGVVGAEQVHQCGAEARATCSSVKAPGAYTAQAARTLAVECRKAGLPVG
jgi:ABC-type Co2+ transport system permease subunit